MYTKYTLIYIRTQRTKNIHYSFILCIYKEPLKTQEPLRKLGSYEEFITITILYYIITYQLLMLFLILPASLEAVLTSVSRFKTLNTNLVAACWQNRGFL